MKKPVKVMETHKEQLPPPVIYVVSVAPPGDLTTVDLAACIGVIKRGAAVDGASVTRELPRARLIAVARAGAEITGVGVIKRIRIAYASGVSGSRKSAFTFDPNIPEIGCIAVAESHRNRGLSRRIVETLLPHEDRFFATTSNEHMKATLEKCGFVFKGCEWRGRTGNRLSLWIKG